MTWNSQYLKFETLLFGVIIVVALVVRIAFYEQRALEPDFLFPQLDALYHHHFAMGYGLDNWVLPQGVSNPHLRETPFYRPPGYPVLLTFLYQLFGPGPWAMRLGQSAMVFILAVLMAVGVKRIYPNHVQSTRLWVLIFCLFQPAILYFEAELVAAVPSLLFSFLAVGMLARSITTSHWIDSALAGGCLGLAIILRPNFVSFFFLVLIWQAVVFIPRAHKLLPTSLNVKTPLVPFIAGVVLCLTPFIARNMTYGYPGLSTNGAITLLHGNHKGADGILMRLPPSLSEKSQREVSPFTYFNVVRELTGNQSEEGAYRKADQLLFDEVRRFIVSEPEEFLRLNLKKMLLLLGPAEIGNNKEPMLEIAANETNQTLPVSFAFILTLGLFGAWTLHQSRHRLSLPQKRFFILAGVFFVTGIASLIPFLAASRLRLPFLWVPILFSAYGAATIQYTVSQRFRGVRAKDGVVLVCAAVFFHVEWIEYEPQMAFRHQQRAAAFVQQGEIEEARASYKKALALEPMNGQARISYARFEFQQHQTQAVIQILDAFLPRQKIFWEVPFLRAMALSKEGRLTESVFNFQKALTMNSSEAKIDYNLGVVFERLGKTDDALSFYRTAIQKEPMDLSPRLNEGTLLLGQKRYQEALHSFEGILEMDPEHMDAQFNRAVTRMRMENWRDAIVGFRQLSEQTKQASPPMQSKIFLNMGVCAEQLANQQQAALAYARSLDFNPKNWQAAMNLARLHRLQKSYPKAIRVLEKTRDALAGKNHDHARLTVTEELAYVRLLPNAPPVHLSTAQKELELLRFTPGPWSMMARLTLQQWRDEEQETSETAKENADIERQCGQQPFRAVCEHWKARHMETMGTLR